MTRHNNNNGAKRMSTTENGGEEDDDDSDSDDERQKVRWCSEFGTCYKHGFAALLCRCGPRYRDTQE
jgi:hypothetical protein